MTWERWPIARLCLECTVIGLALYGVVLAAIAWWNLP